MPDPFAWGSGGDVRRWSDFFALLPGCRSTVAGPRRFLLETVAARTRVDLACRLSRCRRRMRQRSWGELADEPQPAWMVAAENPSANRERRRAREDCLRAARSACAAPVSPQTPSPMGRRACGARRSPAEACRKQQM